MSKKLILAGVGATCLFIGVLTVSTFTAAERDNGSNVQVKRKENQGGSRGSMWRNMDVRVKEQKERDQR